MLLEKTLASPLNCKEIKPVNPRGNLPEYSLEELILKMKLQYFCHLMQRSDSLVKNLMLGKIEGKRKTEGDMVVWHHWLHGHEFVQAVGVGDGQGSLVGCSPQGRKELDTAEWLNWTELITLSGVAGGLHSPFSSSTECSESWQGYLLWGSSCFYITKLYLVWASNTPQWCSWNPQSFCGEILSQTIKNCLQ